MASKLISLTNLSLGGAAMKLSANKVVRFTASGSDTLLGYINQQDKYVEHLMDETVGTINTAAARTQAVTLTSDGSTVYINSDRIIYLDTKDSKTIITLANEGKPVPEVLVVDETAADINTAAGNTFLVTAQVTGSTRYINNLYIDSVVADAATSLPTVSATYKIKVETVALTVQGAGYTSATVSFSGGGTGATLPTASATVAAGAVTQITILTAGSNITADVLVTINGDGAGATCIDKIHHVLDTLTITNGGENLNSNPTMTFSAGTVTATATFGFDTDQQKVISTTITNVGSYIASAFPPTITIAGGAGAVVLYDSKKSSFEKLYVTQTAAAIQTTVNAL